MTMCYRVNAIFQDDPFVILMRQRHLVYVYSLCVNIVFTRPDDVHTSHLRLLIDKGVFEILKCDIILHDILLDALALFGLLSFISIKYAYNLALRPTNSTTCSPPASSLNIPVTFLLTSTSIPDG